MLNRRVSPHPTKIINKSVSAASDINTFPVCPLFMEENEQNTDSVRRLTETKPRQMKVNPFDGAFSTVNVF